MKPVILSGIQPSGELHLGNYFGAISEHLKIDAKANDALFFVADYHALTSLRDPKLLKSFTYDLVATYLALGLSDEAIVFRQSDLRLAPELMWILGCTTNLGLLNRAPAYKEKVEKGLPASFGLFSYPLLMAADILLFNADVIPVGQDQIPHVEIARDVAIAFNSVYGDIFTIPDYYLTPTPKVLGIDGEKMSKSYKNTIPIFAAPNKIEKIVRGIKTSGVDYTREPMPIENDIVLSLYKLVASPQDVAVLEDAYVNDREFGYGQAKFRLISALEKSFGSKYQRYLEIRKDEGALEDRLHRGYNCAVNMAQQTMDRVRKAVGITSA